MSEIEPDSSARPGGRKINQIIGLCVLVFLVLVGVAVIKYPSAGAKVETSVVWLKPLALPGIHLGFFQRLQRDLQRVPMVGKIIQLNTVNLGTQTKYLYTKNFTPRMERFGSPSSTNAEGSILWHLSPEQFEDFENHFHSMPETVIVPGPRAQFGLDMRCQTSMSETLNGDDGAIYNLTTTEDIVGNRFGRRIKLSMVLAQVKAYHTNFALGFTATVKSGGALVLKIGGVTTTNCPDCETWAVLAANLIDAKGRPIK